MTQTMKRLWVVILCLAMIISCMGGIGVSAAQTNDSSIATDSSKIIYADGNQPTFVPAGYTYVYQTAEGKTYTRTADADTYVSGRVLTAQEAKALAELNAKAEGYVVEENGKTYVCREYDAKAAADYSEAVKAILNGVEVKEGDTVSITSEVYTPAEKVRIMITFEDDAVAQMSGMSVRLGEGLGQAEQAASAEIQKAQKSKVAAIEQAVGYNIAVSGHFTLVTNAVSATVNYKDIPAINKMPGVKKAFVMPMFQVPEINPTSSENISITPNMEYAGPGMGAGAAWNLDYKGQGMSVAIIDTGLCFENPSFQVDPEDADSVAFTKDDIAAIIAANDMHAEIMADTSNVDDFYYSLKVPYGFNYAEGTANYGSDDDTWMGHGTHVAGIVAGSMTQELAEDYQMTSLGIAPEAQLIIMKVFNDRGDCYFDWLVGAIEDAIILGVDCANMSLGSPCGPYYFEGMTEVYQAAYDAGVNLVVSAGNDSFTGVGSFWGSNMVKSTSVSTGTIGMPGSFDPVLTVASAENNGTMSISFGQQNVITWYSVRNAMEQMLYFTESESTPEGKSIKEMIGGTYYPFASSMNDAAGKIVFVSFEGGNADAIMDEAIAAGAVAVVVYAPGTQSFEFVDYTVSEDKYVIPIAATDEQEYKWMIAQRPKDNQVRVDLTWNENVYAGTMSTFSSWGPTDGLTMKPEITGIGGNVFSSYYGPYYAIASGTSMSSPAVAASAALVRQYLAAETDFSQDQFAHVTNCLLMSTAHPMYDKENSSYYFVRRQGAGMADIGAAIQSGAYIAVEGTNKAKLELGDDPEKTGVYEMNFSVVNFSNEDKTYTIDVAAMGQIAEGGQIKGGKVTYLTYDYARNMDVVVTSDGTVTVPAGQTVDVSVTVEMTDVEKNYYDTRFPAGGYVEGFVMLHNADGVDLSVPFLAFYGDFGAAPTVETGSYATLLAGERSYSTADQVHTALTSTGGEFPESYTVYLGDTNAPNYSKIPAEEYEHENMWMSYTEFYPEMAGISPNLDQNLDIFNLQIGLLRNINSVKYTVTDRATGEVIYEQDDQEFWSKSYNKKSFIGSELSMEWLYPVETVETEWGSYTIVDYANCLLENDTWVDITAEITPEYPGADVEVVTFPLYIDCKGPIDPEGFTFGCEVEAPWFEGMEPSVMYQFRIEMSEMWFMDYTTQIEWSYIPETDSYEGFAFGSTYGGTDTPMGGPNGSWSQMGVSAFDENTTVTTIAYDYAGNSSVFAVTGGAMIDDMVDLDVEEITIYVGETATITNLAKTDFNTAVFWESSNEALASIVEKGDDYCVVEGVECGVVTVTGGFGPDHSQSVKVIVTSEEREEARERFTDINGHWAEEDILTAVARGLFAGTSDTTFSPEKGLTRGQMVTVLYRMDGEVAVDETTPFTDVKAEDYFADAVAWAYANGIVNGISETTFKPYGQVTREQFASFLYRYAAYKEYNTDSLADLSVYEDLSTVSNYAVDAMAWAVANGIIHGTSDSTLSPANGTNRAQAATMLVRFQDSFVYCPVDDGGIIWDWED